MTRTWSCKSTRKCKDLSGEKEEREEGSESHKQLHEEPTQPTWIKATHKYEAFGDFCWQECLRLHANEKSCGTLTRIWASKAADTSWLAEIHLKYTCFQRFGKGLAKSPTSLTLSSPSPSLLCASFTHAPSVRRLNPSLKIIHWRTAGESRWTTLGASLLGAKVSTRFFYFSLALLSLLRSPKSPRRLRKSVPSVEMIRDRTPRKGPLSEKYPPSCAHREPILPLQRSLNSVRIPAGDSDTLHGSFSKCCGEK